jgi:hypothetical protein
LEAEKASEIGGRGAEEEDEKKWWRRREGRLHRGRLLLLKPVGQLPRCLGGYPVQRLTTPYRLVCTAEVRHDSDASLATCRLSVPATVRAPVPSPPNIGCVWERGPGAIVGPVVTRVPRPICYWASTAGPSTTLQEISSHKAPCLSKQQPSWSLLRGGTDLVRTPS